MSYNYRILNDRPRHYYPLVEGALAYNDATGRANGAAVGTPTTHPPLVVGGGNAMVFDGSNHFRFQSSLFYLDAPNRPFTLEAWFKPLDVTGPKGIVGHAGQNDGLMFDGERIYFTTIHGAAGEATASYYPSKTDQALHVMGVHTESKNELFVNGIRVASVDLTEQQLLAGYSISTAPGYLYSGHHPGSIAVDAVAVYAEALTSRQAKLHFLWGRDVPDFRDVIGKRGGSYWDFTDTTSDVAFDFRFDTDAEWNDAQSASVIVNDDVLYPARDASGVTVAGTWIAGFILPAIMDKVDGSKIEFDEDGSFDIHTSVNDGTTWSPAVNGREVTGLGKGASTAGKSLQVRVTFPAGQSAETITRLKSLSIKLYRARDVTGTDGNKVTLSGKVGLASEIHQPLEYSDRMGVEFYSGGSATLASLSGIRTLEFWVKNNGTTVPTLFGGAGTGTTYVNGATGTPGWEQNRWYHIVYVMDAASTGTLTINPNGADISLGIMGTYPQAMTAADATGLYSAYLGITTAQFVEPSGLIVRDAPDNVVKLYSYDWSTVGSG